MNSYNNSVALKGVTANDWDYILGVENDPEIWQYSTLSDAPYCAKDIRDFCTQCEVLNPHTATQLRLIITINNRTAVGIIDLYDIDRDSKTASIAVVIHPFTHHNKGYAKAAIKELCRYSKQTLLLSTLKAQVDNNNTKSHNLFLSCGFSLNSNCGNTPTYSTEL